ncbi:MAG: pyruvate formate lyase-activating enzyme 1 [Methanocella sp. PtaU1.Bin125]|nr:MAG: pyruvate formate lyase-activating enzyme 1 [Methanocella sp. PtaU1.Bin125]
MQVCLGDIIPTSTLEWPGKVSLVVFFRGCPFKCPYCSNAKFIEPGEPVEIERVTGEISRAKDFIDAVVISGGEPFMQQVAFHEIARHARSLGLKVGAQTNGMYPDRISAAVGLGLLDAVMLDVKAPLELNAYSRAAGDRGRKDILDAVTRTVALCNKLRADGKLAYYEVRTTVFQGFSDSPAEVAAIAAAVRCDAYVIQQGRPEIAMDDSVKRLAAIPRNDLISLARHVRQNVSVDDVKAVKVRTREMGDEVIKP